MAAAPAAASHGDDYLCQNADSDTDGDDDTRACLVQYDTGGDPECQTSSFQYGYTGVEAFHYGDAGFVYVFAQGSEGCFNFFGFEGEYESVDAGAYACDSVTYNCQQLGAGWYEFESSSGSSCDMYVYASGPLGYHFVSMEDTTGNGCPAGGPPNPGWGNVYP